MKNKGITLFLTQLPVGWVACLWSEATEASHPPHKQQK